ncbi:helix-turn-helix transcriptional regulator [Granulicatella adiacens]
MKNNLKGYRNMVGKKQSDFSKILNISEGTYRSKELGKTEFKQSEMKKITSTLNNLGVDVRMEDIFFN